MDETKRVAGVQRMMHNAHLSFQRDELRKQRDAEALKQLPTAVVRGEHRVAGTSERNAQARRAEYWTMANASQRPNFVKAYVETLAYMARHLQK